PSGTMSARGERVGARKSVPAIRDKQPHAVEKSCAIYTWRELSQASQSIPSDPPHVQRELM
ncbi:MAG: hypothetical protein ACREPG_02980, partial [Candidatus Binatia bacterium]